MSVWEIVLTACGVLLGIPAFLLGSRKVVGELRLLADNSAVLTRLEGDKAELMAHVTANRILAADHTDTAVRQLRHDHAHLLDQHGRTLDAVFGLLVDLDAKVSAKKRTRMGEPVGTLS